jgi:two-component system, OmpR family, response regulator
VTKLLIVEDDADVRELVTLVMREEGYAVDSAADATEGLSLALTNDYDALVLDVRLPDGNGMDIVRTLRRESRMVPILMLTAQRTPSDAARGLDAGADDYLGKPFDVTELKARIRSLLRRGGPARTDQLTCGALVINRLTRQALLDGDKLTLTTKEFGVLEHLLAHAEQVVTRSALLEHVWDRTRDPDSNVIDVHIARLRSKLREGEGTPRIATVRGVGFMLTQTTE